MVTTYTPTQLGGGMKLPGALFVDGMALLYFLARTNKVSLFDLGATGDLLRSALRFLHANDAEIRVFMTETGWTEYNSSRSFEGPSHALKLFCLCRYVESVFKELEAEGALALTIYRGHPTRAAAAAAKDADGKVLIVTNNTDMLCFPQVSNIDIIFILDRAAKLNCEVSMGPNHFAFQYTVRAAKFCERLLHLLPAQMPLLAAGFGCPLVALADMGPLHDLMIKRVDLWERRNERGPINRACRKGDSCTYFECQYVHANRLRVPAYVDGVMSEVRSMANLYAMQGRAQESTHDRGGVKLHYLVKRELLNRLVHDVRSNGGAAVTKLMPCNDMAAIRTYYEDLGAADPNVGAPVARPSPPALVAASKAIMAELTDTATEEEVAKAVRGKGPALSGAERSTWRIPTDVPSDMLLLDAVCAALNAKPGRLPMWPLYADAAKDPPAQPGDEAASADGAVAAIAADIAALEITEGNWDDDSD